VSDTMQYKHSVTGVATTAAQALEMGAGLCQDYTHIFLALCRAVGLPARYVSGHMVGEGASHAWCEVLLPDATHGFDPTNARAPNLGYTVVGVGRDYTDVAPTAGQFIGDAAGVLHYEKHAGVLELELESGQVLY
jgi:transglutaminase-like putative cysteine protease